MQSSGIIIAALDCRPDAIEAWNSWYDFDHLPPNVALPGIMSGRRYVATPELSALRSGESGSWWEAGRSTFLTIYTLTADPRTAFDAMVELREQLDADGRMFAEDQKAVRGGDCLSLQRASGRTGLPNAASELPFVGHAGLVVLRRQESGGDDAGDHDDLAAALLSAGGGCALLSYASTVVAGTGLHVLLLEDDLPARAKVVADAVPAANHSTGFSQVSYAAIEPHTYPWAQALRAADLPQM